MATCGPTRETRADSTPTHIQLKTEKNTEAHMFGPCGAAFTTVFTLDLIYPVLPTPQKRVPPHLHLQPGAPEAQPGLAVGRCLQIDQLVSNDVQSPLGGCATLSAMEHCGRSGMFRSSLLLNMGKDKIDKYIYIYI